MTPPAWRTEPVIKLPETPPASIAQDDGGGSMMTTIGWYCFCALLVSQYLNDWSFRLIGNKAYLSTVMIVLVPLIWLICGNALRGIRDRVGLWWIALLLLMLMGVPFSVWKGGSLSLLRDYTFRSLAYFFYVVTFATTLRRVRALMLLNIFCSAILVITCMTFGAPDNQGDMRFRIPDSPFFANSNDLGLQLILNVTCFMFLFYMGGIWRGTAAVAGILLSLIYMLKTGSRGCLVSAIALAFVAFWISKRKLQMIMIALPVLAVAIAVIPSTSLRRLSLIFQPSNYQGLTGEDWSALQSKAEREEVFKKSLIFTATHPLFGIGAGQFAVALTGDAAKSGVRFAWVGTHNSYTQVSSECGIPAFICYMAIIVITFRSSYRMYRLAAGKPQFLEIEGLAFCCLSGILIYSIATFFFHMAYTGLLPLLSGTVVALRLSAGPMLQAGSRDTRI